MKIRIEHQTHEMLPATLGIQKHAFNGEDEAILTENLLNDKSAQPSLSLLAYKNNLAVGHILFTLARVESHPQLHASLLAPLAVLPEYQHQGIGLSLIEAGLGLLKQSGINLVFVLGHIEYYPKAGFFPAHTIAAAAPYPIPEEVRDAWMVHTLGHTPQQTINSKIICANSLMKPEYWVE